VKAVPQCVCMESLNAMQQLKGDVSGGGINMEERQFTSLDFAGSGVESNLQPSSPTSGMRVAPIEDKSSYKSEQTWRQERGCASSAQICVHGIVNCNAGVEGWCFLRRDYLGGRPIQFVGLCWKGVGSNFQPHSATPRMCVASMEEKSSWRSEQTWS